MMDAGQLRGLCIDYLNSAFLLAPRTTVVCASKTLLLLQSSHGAAGSGLREELLPLIRLPAQFSVRAADVIHLRVIT